MNRVQCNFCNWSGNLDEVDEKVCPNCDSINELERIIEHI